MIGMIIAVFFPIHYRDLNHIANTISTLINTYKSAQCKISFSNMDFEKTIKKANIVFRHHHLCNNT